MICVSGQACGATVPSGPGQQRSDAEDPRGIPPEPRARAGEEVETTGPADASQPPLKKRRFVPKGGHKVSKPAVSQPVPEPSAQGSPEAESNEHEMPGQDRGTKSARFKGVYQTLVDPARWTGAGRTCNTGMHSEQNKWYAVVCCLRFFAESRVCLISKVP